MTNNQKPSILAESKRPGTGFTRTTKPNGTGKPGTTGKPDPNYKPPPSVKSS